MYSLVAKIKAKDEYADEIAGAFAEMVEWVAENEPGTLSYVCSRLVESPSEFLVYERYTDEAAFQAHSASPKFAEFAGSLVGKVEGGLEMTLLDEVAAKV